MATDTLDGLTTAMKERPIVSHGDSPILITHRTERSLYTRIIQFVVRRLRSVLVGAKGKHPEGSIKLHPHKIIHRTCRVSERIIEDTYLYDIIPHKTPVKAVRKKIYYFCGGGWQTPPSSQHWQICSKLARDIPDTSITLVSYPLAPNNPASSAFPKLLKLYRNLMQAAHEAGHKVILAGDSSGGNIALALVLEALQEDADAGKSDTEGARRPHPGAIMAICPSTDLTRSNPDIEKLQQFDPLLTPAFIKETAKAWYADWAPTDRRVSPINADLSLLKTNGVKVHGVTGSYDILSPDGVIFRDRCAEEGVSGEWLQWDKQMHCFVLTWPYGVPEGREAVGWIIDVLKKE
ncbi:alpha/beta hydrolase fold-domain-containing protein [Massariosphaeria phaeospora]|uniref:Alpha/beta hydrolase fold-domain-containing protein n=1 Tax=Massariosphaeria phaeospora TaxID=100035 RepID=A0A7C8M1Z1_9PLEO|nr:alpha/beta hydrolase fold-domain-containing protein [Massariosphaeria phaeospora]